MKVVIYWVTKDPDKIVRIRERFGIGTYRSVSVSALELIDLLLKYEKKIWNFFGKLKEEDLFKYVINLNKNGVKMAKFLFAKLVIL